MKKNKKNSGVTLVILIITIIVLLILAGVSLHNLLSDNGIVSETENATLHAKLMQITDDAKMAYKEVYEEKDEDLELGSTVTTADIATKMINKYRI